MLNCIYVGLGGFLGAVCRYLVGLIPLEPESGFPIKTLLINVVGAFAIGVITALAAKYHASDSGWVLFLKTGVCGGFTTFSTFAYEAADLMQNQKPGTALVYMICSMCFGVLAVFASQMLIAAFER